MTPRTGRQSRLRDKVARTQEARWALIGVSLIGLGIAPHVRAASARPGQTRAASRR